MKKKDYNVGVSLEHLLDSQELLKKARIALLNSSSHSSECSEKIKDVYIDLNTIIKKMYEQYYN